MDRYICKLLPNSQKLDYFSNILKRIYLSIKFTCLTPNQLHKQNNQSILHMYPELSPNPYILCVCQVKTAPKKRIVYMKRQVS